MLQKRAKILSSLPLLLIAGLLLLAISEQERYFQVVQWLELYSAVFKEAVTSYVDPVEPEKLARHSIESMLEILDPYSEFITQEDIEEFRVQSTGKYGGIGALVQKRDSFVMIRDPYPGYPAYEGGLRPGDLIIEVDRQRVVGWDVSKVTEMLRGLPGTVVEVRIFRPATGETLTVHLTRAEIRIDPIQYSGWLFKDSDVIYIKLRSFSQGAGRRIRKVLSDLISQKKPKGIILDLRGNPGGLLDEAILVANTFLPQGTEIVSTKGRKPGTEKVYRAPLPAVDTTTPLIVLVDRSSASASEIVAGAIQDLDRGLIVGERTFGKGLVQSTRRLPYESMLKITVARYYTPSGRSIQRLIYTHSDTGKRVIKVPDTLRKAYKTRAGRIVYGGNGIEPDIKVKGPARDPIIAGLMSSYILFDFANYYYFHSKDSIPFADKYEVPDTLLKAFYDTLKARIEEVRTRTDLEIEKLNEYASKDSLLSGNIKQNFEALKRQVDKAKIDKLSQKTQIVKWLLEQELMHRYYWFKGMWTAFLEKDPVLDTALAIINDTLRYKHLLSPVGTQTTKQ